MLPVVTITADDMADEANKECCICLEEHAIGNKATRLPCGHLFHKPCIDSWINKNCTCPVCRYELPTDNAAYEVKRKERMSNRKPRFHRYDLMRMNARELKALMQQLRISPEGCLDKNEYVDKIVNSGKVDVISSAPPTAYKLEDLKNMKVKELKKNMNNAGVFFDASDVVEKADMVAIFVNSGRITIEPPSVGSEVDNDDNNMNDVTDDDDGFVHVISPKNSKRFRSDTAEENNVDDDDDDSKMPAPCSNSGNGNVNGNGNGNDYGNGNGNGNDYGNGNSSSEGSGNGNSHSNSNSNRNRNRQNDNDLVRISNEELKSYSVSNLRHLASRTCVDLSHCLQKSEMVDALITSGKIQLISNNLPGAACDLD